MVATFIFTSLTYEGFAIPCVVSISLAGYVAHLLRAGESRPSTAAFPSDHRSPASGTWFKPSDRTLQWAERDAS